MFYCFSIYDYLTNVYNYIILPSSTTQLNLLFSSILWREVHITYSDTDLNNNAEKCSNLFLPIQMFLNRYKMQTFRYNFKLFNGHFTAHLSIHLYVVRFYSRKQCRATALRPPRCTNNIYHVLDKNNSIWKIKTIINSYQRKKM